VRIIIEWQMKEKARKAQVEPEGKGGHSNA